MRNSGRTVTGGLLFVGITTMLANAASYLLSTIAARIMSVPDFGALGAMLSISIIGGTAALGIQAVGARRIAAASDGPAAVRSEISTLGGYLTLVTLLVGGALSWPLSIVFDAPVGAVLLTFGSIAASVLGFAALGVAQGEEHHRRFGNAYVAVGCLRAAGGVIAMLIHPDVIVACLGIFVGSVAGSAVSVYIARLPRPRLRVPAALTRELFHTLLALIALFALSNTDVLLARIFLDAQQSGEYAVGALIAKIAFFLPYAVITVFYPKMAGRRMHNAFLLAVLLSGALGAIVTAACFVLGDPLLSLLGGEKYSELGGLAWLFALEGSIFAVIQVVLYAGFSSRARIVGALTWLAFVCQIVLVAVWFHHSVQQVVGATTVTAAVLAAAGIWVESRRGVRASLGSTALIPVTPEAESEG